jgi:hypothetical protein
VQQVTSSLATDAQPCVKFPIAARNCSYGFVSFLQKWMSCISSLELMNPTRRRLGNTRKRQPRLVVIPFSKRSSMLVDALTQCTSLDSLSLTARWFTIMKRVCKCLSGPRVEELRPQPTTALAQCLTSLSIRRHVVRVPPGLGLLTHLSVLKLTGYLIVIPQGLRCEACTRLVLNIIRDVRVAGQESFVLGSHFPKLTALSYIVNRQPYFWPPGNYGHPTPVTQCHDLTELQLQLDLQGWHTVFDCNPARYLKVSDSHLLL